MDGLICFKKSCLKEVTAAQPSISCWLCDNVVHAKCAGFSGPTADAVAKRTGLRYCCDMCREVEGEICSFMRQTKIGFRELLGSFRTLSDQFSALDSCFNNLKLLNESPKRKKSTRIEEPIIATQLPIIDQPGTPMTQPLMSFTNPPMVTRSAAKSISIPENVIECMQPVTPKCSVMSAVVSLPVPQKIVLPKACSSSGLPEENLCSGIIPEAPKKIVGVPQKKQIFVSRLAPELTSNDVKAYIQAKTQADDVKVEKFKFSYERDISSFKISAPNELLGIICSAQFWPEHVMVKEFEARKKKNRPPIKLPLPPLAAAQTKSNKKN
jgi:hypothetical protein